MKNIIFVLFMVLSLFVFNCYEEPEQSGDKISVKYSGEFMIFIMNNTHLRIVERNGNTSFYESELIDIFGEFADMDICADKVLGSDYPDEGTLTLQLWSEDGTLLAEDTAEEGESEAIILYNFLE